MFGQLKIFADSCHFLLGIASESQTQKLCAKALFKTGENEDWEIKTFTDESVPCRAV